MPSKVDGIGVASVGVGIVFAWSGIKGYSVLKTVQNVISGRGGNIAQSESQLTNASDPTLTGSGANPGLGGSTPVIAAGNYDHASVMKLWISLGGSSATANNAACHAMQESGGNPHVTSQNPDGGTNVGLFQLDTKGVGAGHSVADLQDPVLNTRITIRATNNGRNWAEWATPGC